MAVAGKGLMYQRMKQANVAKRYKKEKEKKTKKKKKEKKLG